MFARHLFLKVTFIDATNFIEFCPFIDRFNTKVSQVFNGFTTYPTVFIESCTHVLNV